MLKTQGVALGWVSIGAFSAESRRPMTATSADVRAFCNCVTKMKSPNGRPSVAGETPVAMPLWPAFSRSRGGEIYALP